MTTKNEVFQGSNNLSSHAFLFYVAFRWGVLRASDIRVEVLAHDPRITREFWNAREFLYKVYVAPVPRERTSIRARYACKTVPRKQTRVRTHLRTFSVIGLLVCAHDFIRVEQWFCSIFIWSIFPACTRRFL